MAAASLIESARRLEGAGADLHRALTGKACPSHATRAQAAQLGADALAASRMISDLHASVVDDWKRRESQGQRLVVYFPFGGALSDEPVGPFIVLVKAFLIFSRAYQDAMYSLLFELIEGKPTGNRRMQAAADKAG